VVVEEEQEVVREVRVVRRRVPAPVQLSESSVNVDEALRELREKTVEALEEVREKTVEAARGAREEARKVVSKGAEEGKEVVAKGVEGAKEAKGVVSKRVEEAKGMVAKGMEKAHDFAGRAKAAIYLAEEKAESRMDAKLLHISDVERTLQERYDSALREQRLKRSVDEVLQQRYLPVEKRDNSRLRGL
jgi:altered-inheritance-of-mitochondria protein 5